MNRYFETRPQMARLTRITKVWNYETAAKTLPYVRVVLRILREQFIAFCHLYRRFGYDTRNPDCQKRLQMLCKKGVADLEELKRLGILVYEAPFRGIALFPFVVQDDGTPRQAFFVFKDTCEGIEAFILNDEICEQNDLFGYERPIPETWKRVEAVPTLRKEVAS